MTIIDTHSHLFADDFQSDLAHVIAEAQHHGVWRILMPNIDEASIENLHRLADSHPSVCLPMMGLHPTEVGADWLDVLNRMELYFAERKYVGVGEIGIDLYWDTTYEAEQKLAFKHQLEWAKQFSLPVSVHARSAHQQVMKCVRECDNPQLRGVMHSFGGSVDELDEIMSLPRWMVGINGVVTFKNSGLDKVLRERGDLTRIVVETDAPYLAPAPHRGKRNEPAYSLLVVQKLAEIFDTTPEKVARITTENAQRMFFPNKNGSKNSLSLQNSFTHDTNR